MSTPALDLSLLDHLRHLQTGLLVISLCSSIARERIIANHILHHAPPLFRIFQESPMSLKVRACLQPHLQSLSTLVTSYPLTLSSTHPAPPNLITLVS